MMASISRRAASSSAFADRTNWSGRRAKRANSGRSIARPVGMWGGGVGGLRVGLAGGPGPARQRQVVHVVRGVIAVRAVLAEARERTIHDAGIDRPDGLVVAAETFHHARTEALHDHV